ncbi:MAG: TldD protein [Candidatus Cloacimonadota bacterium]|nr:TldD protein [Candidatus Cloacimonadota bacterium]
MPSNNQRNKELEFTPTSGDLYNCKNQDYGVYMKTGNLTHAPLKGVDYYEIKHQENRDQVIFCINSDMVSNYQDSRAGLMCRAYKDGAWGLASSALQDDATLKKICSQAAENARSLALYRGGKAFVLPANPASGEYLFYAKEAWSKKQRCDFLLALDNYIKTKYPALATRQVGLMQDETEKHISTSDGAEFHEMIPRSLIGILMVDNTAEGPVQAYRTLGGFGQIEDLYSKPEEIYEDIDAVYQELMDKKESVPSRAGSFDCVLDSRLAGILAHEAIGHTTEADFVLNGSIAGEFLDQEVASALVTLVDAANTWDGKLCPVPVFIDDEGTRAEDCVIIEQGILRRYMQNKESAAMLGMPLTGNARGHEYSDEPLIRMRNTLILPGQDKLADMISSIEDGYYLVESSNGQADATSEFMFGISLGYEIKNGKLGKAIKDTTMSGIAFDLLKTVSMVSDDMFWSASGMCGKKQSIQVGMGGPAIKCRVNLGGI